MKKFLKKITNYAKNFATKHKVLTGLVLAGAAGFIAAGLLGDAGIFTPDIAHAADGADSDVKETTEQSMAFLISMFIKLLNIFLWPFLILIGDLMDNDMIIGPGMEESLLGIWVQIRNLVNIVFAIMLMVIAIYNILPFSDGEGNLAIKTALPKLILGLVLVNFTFLGGKVLLDVSNVATTAAFAIPEVVDSFDFSEQEEQFKTTVCEKRTEDKVMDDEGNEATWGNTYDAGSNYNEDDKDIPIYTQLFCQVAEEDAADGSYEKGDYTGELNVLMKTKYFGELNANNVGLVMAINMGSLESLSLLKKDAVEDFGDLVINSMFSLIMYVVFALSYIVLGLVLLARIVVLWIVLAMSPLLVLFFVVPQLKEAVGSNLDIWEKATKHLLAPVIIGVVLSIGFIMIAAIGDFADISNYKADEVLKAEFLLSGMEDMEKFIIAIASVVIVWTGIFAAAEGTAAQFATNAVKGFGEQVGTAAARAPLYLPTLPIGMGADGEQERISPLAVMGLADSAIRNLQSTQLANDDMTELYNRMPSWMQTVVGPVGSANTASKAENVKQIQNALSGDTVSQDSFNSNVADRLAALASKAGDDTLARNIRATKDEGQAGMTSLQRILTANNAEKFGVKQSEYDTFTRGLQGKTVTANAATPATPVAPNQQPVIRNLELNLLPDAMTALGDALDIDIEQAPGESAAEIAESLRTLPPFSGNANQGRLQYVDQIATAIAARRAEQAGGTAGGNAGVAQ
jgi:hypothetical protein